MIKRVLNRFDLPQNSIVELLTSGLINRTWKVTAGEHQYVLQQINHQVFKSPTDVAANIRMIADVLERSSPDYLFVSPIASRHKEDLVYEEGEGYFRLFPFIAGSHTIDVVATPAQAYEAALQFGKFTQLLARFDISKLRITIPDFHNLTLRYQQFENALTQGNTDRIQKSAELIDTIEKHIDIVKEFEEIRRRKDVKQRVTHHDTKISNVLFDRHDKGLCVIDLDTVMPGYFISDVGDMMRTYLSPASEEVQDFGRIEVREDFFRAIVQGYTAAMGNELTATERNLILYSGRFLIYMQALRFLTDYLNNDVYYGARYDEHNFVRAGNQLTLLARLEEKEEVLDDIVRKCF